MAIDVRAYDRNDIAKIWCIEPSSVGKYVQRGIIPAPVPPNGGRIGGSPWWNADVIDEAVKHYSRRVRGSGQNNKNPRDVNDANLERKHRQLERQAAETDSTR